MLTTLAHEQGRSFTEALSREEQKQLGQFMTPPPIARFMANRLVAGTNDRQVRVLEPAAGAGILAAAVIEAILAKATRPDCIELLLYEVDPRLVPLLRSLAGKMREACAEAGVTFDCVVKQGDFLLSPLALSGKPVDGLLTSRIRHFSSSTRPATNALGVMPTLYMVSPTSTRCSWPHARG